MSCFSLVTGNPEGIGFFLLAYGPDRIASIDCAVAGRVCKSEKGLQAFASDKVNYSVAVVPIGRGRWLQRIEDTSLIKALVVSIPSTPTNPPPDR